MTTVSGIQPGRRYEGVEELQVALDGVRNRRWWVLLATGVLLVGALWAGGLLVASFCGYWPGQPPTTLRWGMLVLLIALGSVGGGILLRAILGRENLAQTARFIETHWPKLRNDLINPLLLAQDANPPSPALVQCAIHETLRRIRRVDLRRCVSIRPMRNAGVLAALAGAALLTFALLQPGVFRRGLIAALQPGAYVPAGNTLSLLALEPGDANVFAGEPLTIRLDVRATTAENPLAEIVFASNEQPKSMPLRASSREKENVQSFSFHIEAVHEPLRYFVRAGGGGRQGRWPTDRPWFQVNLHSVTVESLNVRYEYPSYTGLVERDVKLSPDHAALEAPTGSFATLTVRLNLPVARGVIEYKTGRRSEMDIRDGGRTFQTRIAIRENGAYRLVFFRKQGRVLLRLPRGGENGYYPIRARADAPPTIILAKPGRSVTISVGDSLPLRIEAVDDFGLTNIQLWTGKEGFEAKPAQGLPAIRDGQKKASLSFDWNLSAYADGDDVVYYASARDNRRLGTLGGPQTSVSPKYKARIRTAANVRADRAKRFDELQKTLLDLLRRQTLLRVQTAVAERSKRPLRHVQAEGRAVYDGQKKMRVDLVRLATWIKNASFAPAMDDVRQAVDFLAANEARLAVDQAQAFMTLTNPRQRQTLCRPLLTTQDAMIHTLQEMLAILPVLAKRLQDADQPLGADLTPEQRRRKRKELAEALKKFQADQKKIIAAGSRLNKKALDDFTDADTKQRNDLIALQDQWEKFLNEAFADFSKLAQQDFANPSLLKELLSIRADITMAKDALKNQAFEIATACEDNGLENAKTLTANLEKWLPDEPDREKWAMEAPEGQENIEQAELFTELEDLMGELLEDEEDLFEEMDDVSSKATMSGDKSIGWDTKDGPISNMNAQGVTGNQLPNTSEIQGRSGEGRTGKSSGEFVEDKAVGKGGRRTPTRLGNDPFQKGKIKDTSTDPAGGATGGGKRSGAGAEGLEGHTPAPTAQQLQHLAGKQASLVNRAERIAAKLQMGDFTSFRMDQAVLLMDRVRRDLEAGRYRNALRRRQATLRAIGQTRTRLGGDLNVTHDASQPLPEQVRDDLQDAMQAPLPEEYRQALQQYYQRLSESSKE